MKINSFYRKWKVLFNPNEWQMRLLGLSFSEVPKNRRGLILIQIDGLSYPDFERARARKHMPFLSRLIRRENYRLWPMYSGIPSNTPAFQGEFFFGKPQCVPAFQYRDRTSGEVRVMFEKNSAAEVEKNLSHGHNGLIEGGSAYGNIFSGGAAESHICASTADWVSVFKAWNPYSLLVSFLFSPHAMLRGIFLCLAEVILAFVDFLRGFLKGQDFKQELLFILTRVLSSILVRDVSTAHALMDIYRGLPVVHINYFGYDEQSHRRGPSTRFAYWSLSGIDHCIKNIWKAGMRAKRRHYDVWIYSDHGQEKVTPFSKLAGKRISEAVQEIYEDAKVEASSAVARRGSSRRRSDDGAWGDVVIGRRPPVKEKEPLDKTKPLVTTLGPIAQIYFPSPYGDEEKRNFAKRLMEKNPVIPLAALPLENGKTEYLTKEGIFHLPEDAAAVFGPDHPYKEAAAKDLESLLEHESRGDLMLFGWCAGRDAISFSNEEGAHAGLGPRETQAFALLSEDAPVQKKATDWIRALDLRQAALVVFGKAKAEKKFRQISKEKFPEKFRVMSYNVHSCVGGDGIFSVERIARVIAKLDPDVVALQELDAGRRIKGGNQAEAIARELEMHFHFHPVCGAELQCFGNAILSRYPMKQIMAEHLPAMKRNVLTEPRGVLWVEIDFDGRPVQVLTTHLSIWPRELQIQIEKFLGPDSLGGKTPGQNMILCGDFNMTPDSKFYQKMKKQFEEPNFQHGAVKFQPTWTSQWPLRKLDYIFMKGNLAAEMIPVPRTQLERFASDHLPVVADFQFPA